ncbi:MULTISPECIES: hypothetical protein [unclassified Aeromicrobium]|jgi:hypothetical protein|nr:MULTISPECIES: hypothetical protein [unclassified Aeromicrobium]
MNRTLDATLTGEDAAYAALEDAFGEAFGGATSFGIGEARTFR